MVCDRRKTKCHLWVTAATVKDKENHVESYFQHGVKNIWWSLAQAHRRTGYPTRRGRTQGFVHSGGLTDTHVCAQNFQQIVIAH